MKKYLIFSMIVIFSLPLISEKIITINMKDIALGRGFPKVTEINGKFYVLDRSQRKIFVFDDKKFLFGFAQAGQGPGDLENPISIAADGEHIYSMDTHTGKISIFSKNGHFLKTFKLKESSREILSFICDLGVYQNTLVVTLTRGKDFVRFYDLQGNLLKTVSKAGEEFKLLGHAYDLNIDEKNNKAYALSRFNGEIYVISLKSFEIIKKLEINDPAINKLIYPIIKKDQAYKPQENFLDLSEYMGFFPLIRDKEKLIVICSSDKLKKGNNYLSYTLNGSFHKVSYMDLGLADVWYIKQFSQYYLLIDKEGDIFLKRRI